jgi:hypothetical protein
MFPRLGSSKLVSSWITVTVVASIVAVVDGGLLDELAAFEPAQIWRGQIWRLATWVVVEPGPLGLVLTCACIYRLAGDLAPRWGERRLQRFLIEVLGGAAVATSLLGLVSADAWSMHRLGGWSVGNALVIAWARQYPRQPLVLYSLLVLSGRRLIGTVIAINVVYALYAGLLATSLELFVCAAAYWYPSTRLAKS